MSLSVTQPCCAECGDRFLIHASDPCGRCHRQVCRACSRRRGRAAETVLCMSCAGQSKPRGLRSTLLYRTCRRLLTG